jgi:hypothetical protein
MQGTLFRQWVEAGYRTYGKDPWFFLRELAQNSRDAGARTVWVQADRTRSNEETLVFSDDGTGMTTRHAQKFLFRLYASSKTDDKFSAGMYGIGFWTVLRFGPTRIIIESNTGSREWAIELDAELQSKKVPCQLNRRGTRVTLIRKAIFENLTDFKNSVRERLSYYCGYLRRNDRKSTPLPVYFHQEKISRDFHLPGIISSRFKKGSLEGAVGFSRKPRVILYARGLPVWEGTILDELSHIASPGEQESEIGQGLAPVFLLNGNNLDVNISRKTIIENRALKEVIKTARSEMEDLINRYAGAIDTGSPFRKIKNRLQTLWRKLKKSFWLKLLLFLMLFIPLEVFILNTVFPSLGSRPGRFFAQTNSFLLEKTFPYPEATVSRFSRPASLEISYQPGNPVWFRVFIAGQFNKKLGFNRSVSAETRIPVAGPISGEPMVIRLKIPDRGKLFLPVPNGRVPDGNQATLNGRTRIPISRNANGEDFVSVEQKKGIIEYSCSPPEYQLLLSPAQLLELTRLPAGLNLPDRIETWLEQAARQPIEEKIDLAIRLTRSYFVYDKSPETAVAWERQKNHSDWIQKAFGIGKGDCDIINSVTALFLRRMGIPARLVVGLIGENGRVLNMLHAWIEYYDRGWKSLDSSGLVSSTSTPPAPPDNGQPASGNFNDSQKITGIRLPDTGTSRWLFFLVSIALCIIPLLTFLLRKRNHQPVYLTGHREEIRRDLARIAMGSILQPGLWKAENPIWTAEIIPTIDHKFLSLKKAIRISRQGKLVIGTRACRFCQEFIGRGIPVLDLGDPAFRPLIKLLPDSLNLDSLEKMKPAWPADIEGKPLARLLDAVNRKLPNIGKDLPLFVWSPGLNGTDFLSVRLPATAGCFKLLNRRKPFARTAGKPGLPEKFLGVNPGSRQLGIQARLFAENPLLACYNLIKTSIAESGLFPGQQQRLQRKAARLLLGEME